MKKSGIGKKQRRVRLKMMFLCSKKNRWATDGIFPLSPTLDTPGPITRNVKDTKLIFDTFNGKLDNTLMPIEIKNMSFESFLHV